VWAERSGDHAGWPVYAVCGKLLGEPYLGKELKDACGKLTNFSTNIQKNMKRGTHVR
jgi:hypothetical protein